MLLNLFDILLQYVQLSYKLKLNLAIEKYETTCIICKKLLCSGDYRDELVARPDPDCGCDWKGRPGEES